MTKTLIILFFTFAFFTGAFGKNEALNWYFGDKAGLTFNTPDGNPVYLDGSHQMTLEGCSAISDEKGNLLFYSDGVNVYDQLHRLMNPLNKLYGHYSSSQSALIIRKPQSDNIYYIFTTDSGEYIENIDSANYENKGLNYSIVDMKLNNGYGEITEYNNTIAKPAAEKISSAFHANGNDIWLIAHEWGTRNFISINLTANGISDTVLSEGLISYSGDIDRYIGIVKLSPKVDKVASTVKGINFIELFDFDNQSGKLSNGIKIYTAGRKENYGIEFSPNGRLLYVSDFNKKTLHQYDVSKMDSNEIAKSETLISVDTVSHSIGALQIAPNGKIYMAINKSRFISSIEKPNEKGVLCDFRANSVFLGDGYEVKSRYGLPNLNQSNFAIIGKIVHNQTCKYDPLILKSFVNNEFESIIYEWRSPNGIITYEKDLVIPSATSDLNGKYYLTVTYRDYVSIDSIEIKVIENPDVRILGDTLICANTKALLRADIINSNLRYNWSTGESTPSITISSPGQYILVTSYPDGCIIKDTINVYGLITEAAFTNPEVGLFGDSPIEKIKNLTFYFLNNDEDQIFISNVYIKQKTAQIKIKNENSIMGYLSAFRSINIDLSIFSNKPLQIDDSLIVEVTSPYCTLLFSTPIYGNIIVPMVVEIPEISTEPAKKIEIPVYSKINVITNTEYNLNYSSKISFNSDYFYVDSCINCTIVSNEVIDGQRFLGVEGENSHQSDSKSILFKLKGTVLIGADEPSPIKIETVKWSDSLFHNEYIEGQLAVSGCSIPLRPIQYYKPTTMKCSPNPAYDFIATVSIYSTEKGIFQLYLTDGAGLMKLIGSWERQVDDLAVQDMIVDLKEFSTGVYSLLLKAPWSIQQERIIIVR